LEEALWFRKGQEVEELVSISLDPDITIQENDQYVTIRGSLVLTGEYKSHDAEHTSEEEGEKSQKFVESVEEREEGNCDFSHRFPVDITIPNNRIQSIYDIDVLVDSFDYSLPERSCLKLSAELTISGLYGAEQQEEILELEVLHRSEDEYSEEEPYADQESYNEEPLLFEAEARKQQEEESVAELPKFPNFSFQPQQHHNYQQDNYQQDNYQQEYPWYYQQPRSDEKHVEVKVEVEVEEEIFVESVPEHKEHFEEESSSSPEHDLKEKIKNKLFKKKSMTLTEFFARKDENSEQAKLKVCIVQRGDTVDSIADRYHITVQNLLKVNNLEINHDVFEGQVLYIPVAYAKK
jgi:stage VI sporulation protein D